MRISRKHWSYSSINQFLRCPRQFYFQRIAKIPQLTVGSGLVLGSAVHSALAEYHNCLVIGVHPSQNTIKDFFVTSWLEKESETKVVYKPKESKDGLIELGASLLELYLNDPPPENIIAVEQSMMAPIQTSHGEIIETPLYGFVDLLTKEGDEIKIREFKTSARAFSNLEASTSLQPTCYVMAVESTYDLPATVEYNVFVKTKTPKLQKLDTARHEEDFGRLGDIVQSIERAIKAEAFYPVETPMNCSCCSYRSECREWTPPKPINEIVQLTGMKIHQGC